MTSERLPPPAYDESWDHHYADERDAAWMYRKLAAVEKRAERRDLFARLAEVEDQHTARWEELFRLAERPLPSYAVSARTKALAWIAKTFGSSSVLPLILREEGREVQAYLGLAGHSSDHATHQAAVDIASDSAVHARELSEVMGREGEPWHLGGAGGLLRSIVYGFNDGLTANFGLVAGVIGANLEAHVVILTGVAGALADALSMGASGYLAAKSEAEVHAHQVELERQEMRLMPDLEEAELALIYEAKGLPKDRAKETAQAVMRDPVRALATKVSEGHRRRAQSVYRPRNLGERPRHVRGGLRRGRRRLCDWGVVAEVVEVINSSDAASGRTTRSARPHPC